MYTLLECGFAIFSSLVCFVLVYRELSPKTRLNYSKFTNNQKSGVTIPSKQGMLIIYVPSLIASASLILYSFIYPHSFRVLMIAVASFIHYTKRVYEVNNVHRYSGEAKLMDNVSISLCYLSYVFIVYLFSSIIEHASNVYFFIGFCLFMTGESVNYYHHQILSRLRDDGCKSYKIPYGGLFEYCWCPHYLGEIITFISISFMSQHFIVFIMQLGSIGYLTVRAYNTKLWYQSKFESIPDRYCLFPGIF